jgi:hypothetical protein
MRDWQHRRIKGGSRRVGSALGNAPGLPERDDLQRLNRHQPEAQDTRSKTYPAPDEPNRITAVPPLNQRVRGSSP